MRLLAHMEKQINFFHSPCSPSLAGLGQKKEIFTPQITNHSPVAACEIVNINRHLDVRYGRRENTEITGEGGWLARAKGLYLMFFPRGLVQLVVL